MRFAKIGSRNPPRAMGGYQMTTRVLRLSDVLARVGLCRSQIYRMEALGKFPARIKLTPRSTAWLEADIEQWISARVTASGRKANG
jgi:prophage regulatory protein